jgi:hypothetical protein
MERHHVMSAFAFPRTHTSPQHNRCDHLESGTSATLPNTIEFAEEAFVISYRPHLCLVGLIASESNKVEM